MSSVSSLSEQPQHHQQMATTVAAQTATMPLKVGAATSSGDGSKSGGDFVGKLQEQLVDLYLSVKIRSNEEVINDSFADNSHIQIDNYSEDLLSRERRKLRDVESGTLVEYIKTSIEILMNMRLEEYQLMQQQKTTNKKGGGKQL